MKRLMIALISLATAVTSLAPVQAMPLVAVQKPAEVSSDVQQVASRRYIRRHHRSAFRHDRRWDRRHAGWHRGRHDWRHDRRYSGRYYRHHRHGYGVGVPLGAFAAGAIIGGALNSSPAPRSVYRASGSHTSWCYNRYRSYRAYDNTFQPYNGPRQQCYSPYR